MDENGASRRADRPQGSHPGLCRWGHQKPDCVGCCPSPSAPPAEGCSIRRKKPTVVSNQTLFTPGPTAQIPNAKSKPSESSSATHIPQGNDTGYLGGEQGLGSQQGARTPSSLTHGLGGDSFPPPHELGWQGAAPSPPCPVSQGQLSSEPLGAAPGAALRAAHTGARGLGAPRDPRAGLWGAAGSVLRQRLEKRFFHPWGFAMCSLRKHLSAAVKPFPALSLYI